MPRSVIVMSADPDLFSSVRAALRSDSRFVDSDAGLHCDGSVAPLTNIYPVATDPAEWDGWDPRDSQMPDAKAMASLILESRSPIWVAEIGRLLAHCLDTAVWFVDAADTAWPADGIDPDRIALA